MKLTFTHSIHSDTVIIDIPVMNVLELNRACYLAMRQMNERTGLIVNQANVMVSFPSDNMKLAERQMKGND